MRQPVRLASSRFVSTKLARLRSAPLRSALLRFTLRRSVTKRFALRRSASLRSAPLRFTLRRSAPERLGLTDGSVALHSFQAVIPCQSRSRWSASAIAGIPAYRTVGASPCDPLLTPSILNSPTLHLLYGRFSEPRKDSGLCMPDGYRRAAD